MPHPHQTLLTVEMVPRTAWMSNVRSEVTKAVWDRIRKEVAAEAGNRCEICGGQGSRHPVEIHEVWHYDDERKIQRLVRLQALCPKCHMAKHFGYAESRKKGDFVMAHIAKVNGWSRSDVRLYLEECYELWMRRSVHEWKLDLSLLERFGVQETKNGLPVAELRSRPA